jgi:hypothetical protein
VGDGEVGNVPMAGFGAAHASHVFGFAHPAHPDFQSTQVKCLARGNFGRICCADSVWCGEGGADSAGHGSKVVPGDLRRPVLAQAEMEIGQIRGNPPRGDELRGISNRF